MIMMRFKSTQPIEYITKILIVLSVLLMLWACYGFFELTKVLRAADTVSISKTPAVFDLHLLGQYRQTEDTNVVNLPEAMVDFTVTGIFATSSGQQAMAVINRAGHQKLYRLSAEIEPGVKLVKVLPKAIILSHNGHLEVLSLRKKNS
jgi:type II secretory pathway component PulC